MAPHFRRWASAAALLTIANALVRAQDVASTEAAASGNAPPEVTSGYAELLKPPTSGSVAPDEAAKQQEVTCLEPLPFVKLEDYQGPFQKVVGAFAGKLELKSAHLPHYKTGTVLCSLQVKDKFMLFARDTFDPLSFLSAAFNAGLDHSSNRDPTFGQGAAGYGKRFGADFAQQTTSRFLSDFAYPTMFSEDPRYYRLPHGTGGQRLFHAVEHTFVAQHDSGKPMFNASKWLGTASSLALRNVYHPGNERGLSPALRAGGFSLAVGMGFDVLREFWPEIARNLKMPFRCAPETLISKPIR
jgi:hypothetical protein